MSINEKIIFDYNIFYEECMQAFPMNPVVIAQRLVAATELYDSIMENSIVLSDLSDEDLKKLMEMDNVFDAFLSQWIKRNHMHSAVEEVFIQVLAA